MARPLPRNRPVPIAPPGSRSCRGDQALRVRCRPLLRSMIASKLLLASLMPGRGDRTDRARQSTLHRHLQQRREPRACNTLGRALPCCRRWRSLSGTPRPRDSTRSPPGMPPAAAAALSRGIDVAVSQLRCHERLPQRSESRHPAAAPVRQGREHLADARYGRSGRPTRRRP